MNAAGARGGGRAPEGDGHSDDMAIHAPVLDSGERHAGVVGD
jgi:hypothetical protein